MMCKLSKKLLLFLVFFQITVVSASTWAVSLEEEIKLGKEEHSKIIARFGAYRNQELQAYINKVGERVSNEADREEIDYKFTILNDDMINAFAFKNVNPKHWL